MSETQALTQVEFQEADFPVAKRMRLRCCVCGESAIGRQWFNRDTGYGVCVKCVDWVAGRGETPEEIRSNYGVRGVHYAIEGVTK